MGSSGKSSGSTKTTIRYAGYIEDHHKAFLSKMATYRDAAIDDSPFDGYSDIACDLAFFGTGYTIASFPSLYDMYGKFMAGLDIDILYGQIFEDTVNASEVSDLVAAEADLLDDDISTNVLPRFQTGMRDINAVMTSTFVTGKALIEDARVKSTAKFDAELRYRLIPVTVHKLGMHLDWNRGVVMSYAEILKLYFSAKMDIDNFNYTMLAKDKLWPFTVLEYDRAAIGALQGATNTKTNAGDSGFGGAISGALSGAATGAMIGSSGALGGMSIGGMTGGPLGAMLGGILGLAGGLF